MTVKVLTASSLKNFGISGIKKPAVVISCEGQEIITNPANFEKLEWNEAFSFNILNGQGDIMVEVVDTENKKKINSIGKLFIPLAALEDQKVHNQEFELRNEAYPDRITGKIVLELHWVYDLPKFLEGLIEEYNLAIHEDKEELELMENFLKELQSPLPKVPVTNSTHIETNIANKIDQLYNNTVGNKVEWSTLNEVVLYTFLLMSTVSMVFRPDFVNVFVS